MKITILSTAYPLRGGISHFVGLLYKELARNNEVSVITFKRQYPSILFPGKSQLESGDTVEKIPTGIPIKIEKSMVEVARSKVFGNRSRKRSMFDLFHRSDLPKSPRMALEINIQYWV